MDPFVCVRLKYKKYQKHWGRVDLVPIIIFLPTKAKREKQTENIVSNIIFSYNIFFSDSINWLRIHSITTPNHYLDLETHPRRPSSLSYSGFINPIYECQKHPSCSFFWPFLYNMYFNYVLAYV